MAGRLGKSISQVDGLRGVLMSKETETSDISKSYLPPPPLPHLSSLPQFSDEGGGAGGGGEGSSAALHGRCAEFGGGGGGIRRQRRTGAADPATAMRRGGGSGDGEVRAHPPCTACGCLSHHHRRESRFPDRLLNGNRGILPATMTITTASN
uniref:Uncharacterized protein n=1 Tax=Oryza nivara TaxID=4536 RepID=A0A0E0J7T0_ORYNI